MPIAFDPFEHYDDESSDEDPIIVRMLDSMLPKNTTTPGHLVN